MCQAQSWQEVDQATPGRVLCLSVKWVVGDHDTDFPGCPLRVEIRCIEGSVSGLPQTGHGARGHHCSFTIQHMFIEHLLGAGCSAGH